MESLENINERRELDKMSLETFLFDKTNILDFDIDKLIKTKLDEIEKIHLEFSRINESDEKYEEISELYENSGLNLREYEHSLIQDMQYYEDDAFVLYEVKIIYAYKHFEINLKKLLSSAYRDPSVKKIFHWYEFAQYLKLKGIEIKKNNQFAEIDELRIVNNALKHSGEIDKDEIKKIKEFKGKTSFKTSDLELFYSRVKDSPNSFLSSLSLEVNRNLYMFDEDRLQKIAKHFALRMEENIAIRFTEILKGFYK